MLEEKSQKFALCRDNPPSKGSLSEPLSTCATTQTCTLPSRSISWQNDARNLPIPHLEMKCWLCDQFGHKKMNCPQAICFFCGRPGHLKRVCLNFRLAKMYDQEKDHISWPPTNTRTIVEKKHSAAKIAHTQDDSSCISVEDTLRQQPEATNLLEPLIEFVGGSEEEGSEEEGSEEEGSEEEGSEEEGSEEEGSEEEGSEEESSEAITASTIPTTKQEDSLANQVPVRLDHLKVEDSSTNQILVRLDHLKENSLANQMPVRQDPTLDLTYKEKDKNVLAKEEMRKEETPDEARIRREFYVKWALGYSRRTGSRNKKYT